MAIMDKTVKTRSFPSNAKSAALQSNLTEAQEKSLELANKNAQLEGMKSKLLEHFKTIEQLRESLKQEQAKSAGMAEKTVMLEAKVKELAGLESNVKKVAELEARVKELSEKLSMISGIAAAGKPG